MVYPFLHEKNVFPLNLSVSQHSFSFNLFIFHYRFVQDNLTSSCVNLYYFPTLSQREMVLYSSPLGPLCCYPFVYSINQTHIIECMIEAAALTCNQAEICVYANNTVKWRGYDGGTGIWTALFGLMDGYFRAAQMERDRQRVAE